jgi:hypothetical protein
MSHYPLSSRLADADHEAKSCEPAHLSGLDRSTIRLQIEYSLFSRGIEDAILPPGWPPAREARSAKLNEKSYKEEWK